MKVKIIERKDRKKIKEMNEKFCLFKDPYKNFGLPSIGRLYKYIEPTHIPNVSIHLTFTHDLNTLLQEGILTCFLPYFRFAVTVASLKEVK